jgi:hypothetical protein
MFSTALSSDGATAISYTHAGTKSVQTDQAVGPACLDLDSIRRPAFLVGAKSSAEHVCAANWIFPILRLERRRDMASLPVHAWRDRDHDGDARDAAPPYPPWRLLVLRYNKLRRDTGTIVLRHAPDWELLCRCCERSLVDRRDSR